MSYPEIREQIKFMVNANFDNVSNNKLDEMACAAHNVLGDLPREIVQNAFRAALKLERKTKYPSAYEIQRFVKNKPSGVPENGYYDLSGQWIPEGTYYTVLTIPLEDTSKYLNRQQWELSRRAISYKANDIDKQEFERLKSIQFYPLKGCYQTHRSTWISEQNEKALEYSKSKNRFETFEHKIKQEK